MIDRILCILFPSDANYLYIEELNILLKDNCSAYRKNTKKKTAVVCIVYDNIVRFDRIAVYNGISFVRNLESDLPELTNEFSEQIDVSKYLQVYKSQRLLDAVTFVENNNAIGIKILKESEISKGAEYCFIEPEDYQYLVKTFMRFDTKVTKWIKQSLVGKILVIASGKVTDLGNGSKFIIKENYNKIY